MTLAATDTLADANSLGDLLNSAREAMRGGRFGDAEHTCETIVETHPEQPDAWFLLGVAALRSDKPDVALPHLTRAMRMRRGFAPYRIALGQALLKIGDPEQARMHFNDAITLDPMSHEAALGLASAHQALGDRAAAANHQKEGLRLLRHFATGRAREKLHSRFDSWLALASLPPPSAAQRAFRIEMRRARRLESGKKISEALAAYESAHAASPENYRPLHAIGRLAFEAEDFVRSLNCLETARELRPSNTEIECDYGRTLSRMARHEEALEILEAAHLDQPEALRPLIALGWARFRAGQSQRAIADFDAVLEQPPRSQEAHYGRARALIDAGQTTEAKKWLRRTIDLSPGHPGALRELAILKDLTPADPGFSELLEAANDPSLPASRRSVLHMAAGAAYVNVKANDDGFEHWRRGNLLKDAAFDIEAYRAFVDRIIATFDNEHFRWTEGWGAGSDVPVFVLGMPRSGTSLVEQILASHSSVFGAGEREDMLRLADALPERLNDSRAYPLCVESLTRDSASEIASKYLNVLRRADPHAARIVDKMPGNFHHVGLIATLFPNARIVRCVRDPRDTCLSIYFGDFVGSHPYSYDLRNLGQYHREYERLMDHWQSVLPGRILDVAYEDIVADQEGRSRALIAHCGLEWEAACLDFHKTRRNVRTRSNAQVRQPIYSSSIGRWKAFGKHLTPLIDALDAR